MNTRFVNQLRKVRYERRAKKNIIHMNVYKNRGKYIQRLKKEKKNLIFVKVTSIIQHTIFRNRYYIVRRI